MGGGGGYLSLLHFCKVISSYFVPQNFLSLFMSVCTSVCIFFVNFSFFSVNVLFYSVSSVSVSVFVCLSVCMFHLFYNAFDLSLPEFHFFCFSFFCASFLLNTFFSFVMQCFLIQLLWHIPKKSDQFSQFLPEQPPPLLLQITHTQLSVTAVFT